MCRRINLFYPCLLGGYYVFSIIVSIILSAIETELPLWLSLVLSQGILLAIALVYVLINKINIVKCIPYRKLKIGDAIFSILFGYAIVPLVLLISNITMLFSTNHVAESSNELTTYPFLLQIFLMAVIPPLVEEFICRGLFYHSYRKNGILGAAVASGLVFGILHLNINQFCYAFLMGIMFAFLVEATGSIWSSVLAHFSFNTYSIIMMKVSEVLTSGESVEDAAQTVETGGVEMFVVRIMAIIMLAFMAAIFTALAFIIFMTMAKRNGRWEYIKQNFKWGMKPRNGEKFFDLSFILTSVIAGLYMISTEIMIYLSSLIS
ncbi:MAG: CPBP family intramembrane metalloprotease [Lachnospira sp.]|nr:CPBP family intramembrane metalloprotease [Lachnospira sp.]